MVKLSAAETSYRKKILSPITNTEKKRRKIEQKRERERERKKEKEN